MSKKDIIRSWKDAQFRDGLSEEELANMPQNPAGLVELNTEDLEVVNGAATAPVWSFGCCGTYEPTEYYTCWGFTVCGSICPTAPHICV